MANFKAHITFGAITAVCFTGVTLILSWTLPVMTPLVFLFVLVGSMLPDIDSDSGIPVRLLFATLAIAAVGLTWISPVNITGASWLQQGLLAAAVGLFVYFVVGPVFKHFTAHRGIFHSIPAALLMGLVAMSMTGAFTERDKTVVVIGLAVTTGYLAHLVLDELNSATNLDGKPFRPKKSLGTALKLTSSSKSITALTYCALLLFLWLNVDHFIHGFR